MLQLLGNPSFSLIDDLLPLFDTLLCLHHPPEDLGLEPIVAVYAPVHDFIATDVVVHARGVLARDQHESERVLLQLGVFEGGVEDLVEGRFKG